MSWRIYISLIENMLKYNVYVISIYVEKFV